MKTMSENENKGYKPIFNHKMYEHTLTKIQFVVPWQMNGAVEGKKDLRQFELKFGL